MEYKSALALWHPLQVLGLSSELWTFTVYIIFNFLFLCFSCVDLPVHVHRKWTFRRAARADGHHSNAVEMMKTSIMCVWAERNEGCNVVIWCLSYSGMEDRLCCEKTSSDVISTLPVWIIEYAWTHRMMEVLEGKSRLFNFVCVCVCGVLGSGVSVWEKKRYLSRFFFFFKYLSHLLIIPNFIINI